MPWPFCGVPYSGAGLRGTRLASSARSIDPSVPYLAASSRGGGSSVPVQHRFPGVLLMGVPPGNMNPAFSIRQPGPAQDGCATATYVVLPDSPESCCSVPIKTLRVPGKRSWWGCMAIPFGPNELYRLTCCRGCRGRRFRSPSSVPIDGCFRDEVWAKRRPALRGLGRG